MVYRGIISLANEKSDAVVLHRSVLVVHPGVQTPRYKVMHIWKAPACFYRTLYLKESLATMQLDLLRGS